MNFYLWLNNLNFKLQNLSQSRGCNPNLLTFTGSCGGGNPDDIPKYEVMAGAREGEGFGFGRPLGYEN